MIKSVIFDLDGTLLNRDASVQKFIDNQYDRLNEWIGHIPRGKYTSRFPDATRANWKKVAKIKGCILKNICRTHRPPESKASLCSTIGAVSVRRN